ncbi:MAG: penicillin acylase family protein, partial [Fimbriimonas ginsengisoli]|nr:penicillin acylase family protein [Fimbriimonas ginsengisoli]
DVPGIPGVAIGYTPNVAWGLTTGAADVEDIVYVKDSGTDGYELNGAKQQLEHDAFAMPVKGGQAKTVDQVRTSVGPVVAHTASGYLFCRRSPTWMREIKSIEAIYGLYQAKGPDDIDKAAHSASVNFNLFYATSSGDIGWRFLGDIPLRRLDLDPRLPTPAGPAGEWRGLLPFEQMPHVVNPRSGLIYNWNNKPVSWWANGATPAWGRIFHSEALGAQLGKPRLSAQDLEMAIWNIARADSSWPHFKDVFEDAAHSLVAGKAVIPPPATNAPSGPAAMADAGEAAEAAAFDGQLLDGSRPALAYRRFINRLRDQMFLPITGNFMNQDTFRLAVQESVIWNALHRRTKVDYTSGRSPSAVAEAALSAAAHLAPGAAFRDQGFPVADEPPVPYGNRGTYIQIVEATGHGFRGRNVLPPGVSESGRHSHDQSVLARSWLYKPMVPLGSP